MVEFEDSTNAGTGSEVKYEFIPLRNQVSFGVPLTSSLSQNNVISDTRPEMRYQISNSRYQWKISL